MIEWASTRFSLWVSLAMEAAKEIEIWHNGSLGGEDDAQTSNTRLAQRKRAIPHSMMKNNCNMTSILVTALCNQPVRFSDGAL